MKPASGDDDAPSERPSTVGGALAWARGMGVDRLDAQLLLGFELGRPRAWLIAHDDAPLDAAAAQRHGERLARRADGVPLAYLLGEKECHGLLLHVAPDVLVPRPDTETLIDWALQRLAGLPAPGVLDLGTGSGAIALAVRHACPAAQVTATDLSEAALAVARGNARRLGLAVDWRQGDWWSAVAGCRFDVVVSNPPYIAEGDPHLPALRHEPRLALVSGPDGLEALRCIVAAAPRHLHPGGWLLMEHGFEQAGAVQGLLRARGFTEIETRRDLGGQPRCTGGRYAAPTA